MVVLFLVAATVVVFWQILGHEFINYDDSLYVTENKHVWAGPTRGGLVWAFTTFHHANWHPLTWLSHMLDCRLFGLDPMGHHLTSLLLHIANTLLLLVVLRRMTGSLWRSAFVAALFAIHPLHVESVAWVAERKDVLSTLFWMLTMWAYVRYTESPKLWRYLSVVLFFALGLMAKPMLVTLPFVLLLLDYWPLRRLASGTTEVDERARPARRLIWEKTPLFALAAASGIVTYLAQQKGEAVSSLEAFPMGIRVANAVVAYVTYIGKTVWPRGLAVFYPHPGDTLPAWQVLGAGLVLACISILAIRTARRRPYLAVGWLWYLGTLVPVIGLIQVGMQAMSDRYTHVPLIGIFVVVAWGIPDLLGREERRTGRARERRKGKAKDPSPSGRAPVAPGLRFTHSLVLSILAGTAIAALMARAWVQAAYWHDSITLFQHALNVTADNVVAHNNLGVALSREGKSDEAIDHFSKVLEMDPDHADAHANLGVVLANQGNLEDAIAHYSKALQVKPDNAEAHTDLGVALARKGRMDEAIDHFSEALEIDPKHAGAHTNMGNALAYQGNFEDAIAHFSKALDIKPNNPEAHTNLGLTFQKQGKIDEAVHEFRKAIRIKPDLAPVHYYLASALLSRGDYTEAWQEVHLYQEYGGSPSASFLDALSKKMPEPDE